MLEILFICTGNTCRSPMAQALLNDKAQKRGLPVSASSAGLAAFAGDTASENAVRAMAEIGIDISTHRASRLSIYALESSDLIVCMSESHRAALAGFENVIVANGGISDPYGGNLDEYRKCRDELSAFIDVMLENLFITRIEAMSEADVGAVAKLEKECFSVPWSEQALRDELSNETAHFFVAKRFGQTAGYIGMHQVLDECYITNVAVLPKFRRCKIGSELVEYTVNFAKENEASFVSLEVRESNQAAISLYNKFGFAVCGERKNFYDKPRENGLIMTKFFNEDDQNEDIGN
ncbi:MAG: ribosomal protein S18-alanine N-acetyltransferase [Ruminococcus sp.]|nr:ribosomal protein S18-alanine N-acetyltransferase [Ruminococcus sp.]